MNWLPDDFDEQRMEARASRAINGVQHRVRRRGKVVRSVRWTGAAFFVTALAFFLAPRLDHHAPSTAPGQMASSSGHPSPAVGEGLRPLPSNSPAANDSGRAQRPAPTTEMAANPRAPVLAPHLPISSSPHLGVPDISMEKTHSGVELKWQGDPTKDYVVYRCTSPRFDTCSMAGTVKGTQWTDREAEKAPLVFYKVEPKSGA